MDEEDGRPGAKARQSDPADVVYDASAGFLRYLHTPQFKAIKRQAFGPPDSLWACNRSIYRGETQ